MKKYIIASILFVCGVFSLVAAQNVTFTNDIRIDSTGADVMNLQSWLISKGYDIPAISSGVAQKGYFGSQTKVAVMKYQADNGIPNTGFVGPLTRGRLNNVIVVKPGAPVIKSIDAPTTLKIGESGTWSVKATDPAGKTLSYAVTWGDEAVPYMPAPHADFVCPDGYPCKPNFATSPSPFIQQSTFTHAYSLAGTFEVSIIVKNSDGLSTRSSATVKVTPSGANPLKVISPNGGETWYQGDTQTIRWNSPAYIRATYADIRLIAYYTPCVGSDCYLKPIPASLEYIIASNISINRNTYSWKVGNGYFRGAPDNQVKIFNGEYYIQICETGTNNCTQSSAPFTIASRNPASIIRVDSPNGGESWESQSVHQIKWTLLANDKAFRRVDLYADQVMPPCLTGVCPMYAQQTYTLDKNIAQNAVYNWIVATDVVDASMPTGLYTIKICVAGSTTDCDVSDTAFTITSRLLRVCPDQKIIDRMPTVINNGGIGAPVSNVALSPARISSYYILNGKRHEIAEFDANWVGQNCRVTEQTVY